MPAELVVISGKGGTGKTSIVACFAALAEKAVLADCDVDAADLHLVLAPTVLRREEFSGGSRARILADRCTACGRCAETCRFGAISFDAAGKGDAEKTYRVDPIACEGCGVCAYVCPEGAVEFAPAVNGEWYVSETRFGPMVHARLGVAEENSGKLVALVRKSAKEIAQQREAHTVLIDGSPGVGCPVIASVAGADLALAVTEPTLSGLHDLRRVAGLTDHFAVKTLVCVNKWDLNEQVSAEIERWAREHGLELAGKVRYDRAVTEAQIKEKPVVECRSDGAAADISRLWLEVSRALDSAGASSAESAS
jgi:MinD superfamily P-loop ATPase